MRVVSPVTPGSCQLRAHAGAAPGLTTGCAQGHQALQLQLPSPPLSVLGHHGGPGSSPCSSKAQPRWPAALMFLQDRAELAPPQEVSTAVGQPLTRDAHTPRRRAWGAEWAYRVLSYPLPSGQGGGTGLKASLNPPTLSLQRGTAQQGLGSAAPAGEKCCDVWWPLGSPLPLPAGEFPPPGPQRRPGPGAFLQRKPMGASRTWGGDCSSAALLVPFPQPAKPDAQTCWPLDDPRDLFCPGPGT